MANILVVDDELGIRELLSEILNDEGHTVELAENAAQARAARLAAQPDLVLLDIWMPDTDGVTLLKEWRAAGLLTMPVLMMSGHASLETAGEATRIGAQAFLEKPITLQKLLNAVQKALSRETKAPPPPLTARPTAPAPLAASAAAPSAPPPTADAPPAIPPGYGLFDLEPPLRQVRDAFEKAYFEYHLAKENGSMTRIAERTGLERTHLYRKLKQLNVDLTRNRKGAEKT